MAGEPDRKACSYCGRDNGDGATHCRECGTEFRSAPKVIAVAEPEEPLSPPQFVDLSRLQGAFDFREGFSRPDWKVIANAIQAFEAAEDRREAWREVALQWLAKLREELGGKYHLVDSRRCALLSALERPAARRLLNHTEDAAAAIREALREVAWGSFDGLLVILSFAEEDDYFQYIADFYAEGEHPTSSGVHVHRDYPHVALLAATELAAGRIVVHELTHHCLAHLPLPLWVHEGVAQHLEKIITGTRLVCEDLAEQHFAFWNSERIQAFWAGISFHEPGESVQLSYNLAEILVHFLIEKNGDFHCFLRNACADDAGQTAAWDCLGCCLGETIGTFLGPGDWRPQRKAIKAYWNPERAESDESKDAAL